MSPIRTPFCLRKASLSLLMALGLCILPGLVWASSNDVMHLDLTRHGVGYAALLIFGIAYVVVMAEEFTRLRKSKPVVLAAGIIWAMIAAVYVNNDMPDQAAAAVRHNLLEYTELMLFLLVAMTYVNTLEERLVFDALRSWLVRKGFGFRQLYWMTGILTFFLSPIADNLTTALLMCAVVLAVGGDNKRFVSIACVNIVVAANAGGAFSPFGDITTLMVWQEDKVDFWRFFLLFVPSVVNFIVPAAVMHFAIPDEQPDTSDTLILMRRGSITIMALFLLTIASAVSFHNVLHLPPVIGMLTGLAYLQFFGYFLKRTHHREMAHSGSDSAELIPFNVFSRVASAEWDTLLFFYGVVLCVGGLGFMGYLAFTSDLMYTQWGATNANVAVGLLSAIVDNIPVMFAVLTMNPDMSQGQWLLVTLTAGVGGSMLSIGSAAGVALMGQTQGQYTFFSHLKWMPVIALGYAASIATHLWINASQF